MKSIILTAVAALGVAVHAGESQFIAAYDAGKYDDAAKQIDGLDTSKPEVARRLGVMYYDGRGVAGDQVKGRDLLEAAMLGGDATAAINLAKIYFKLEKNSPKAAWCLLVAEGSGDASVKEDVAKLHERLGDQYLKGVELYIKQLRGLVRDEQAAIAKKTLEYDKERASLRQQITSAAEKNESLEKKLKEATEAAAEEKGKAKDLAEKLSAATDEKAKLAKAKDELDAASKSAVEKEASSSEKNKKLEEELAKIKAELESTTAEAKKSSDELEAANKKYKEIFDKYNDLVASSNQRVSTGTTALAEAKTELEEANKKYKDMLGKYNKLVEKYNDLVKRYNNAMKLLKSGTVKLNPKELENLDDEMIAQILNAAEERDRAIDRYGSFGRAWNTFFCFPCNFIRSGFAAHNIYSAFDNKVCGFFTAAISTPVVFCCEVVPAVCDFGNGLVDMLSAGTYGDWLYSGDLTSQWYKRDDTHFPWLDREK